MINNESFDYQVWHDLDPEKYVTLDEVESVEYDLGPEVDDEGGMSEFRHYNLP